MSIINSNRILIIFILQQQQKVCNILKKIISFSNKNLERMRTTETTKILINLWHISICLTIQLC